MKKITTLLTLATTLFGSCTIKKNVGTHLNTSSFKKKDDGFHLYITMSSIGSFSIKTEKDTISFLVTDDKGKSIKFINDSENNTTTNSETKPNFTNIEWEKVSDYIVKTMEKYEISDSQKAKINVLKKSIKTSLEKK